MEYVKPVVYDKETALWFSKHPEEQTTVCKCEYCGLFYKPSLNHKCKKEKHERR